MFHYSLRVIDEPNMSEIRILNLCHKKSILVDIYRQSLLISCGRPITSNFVLSGFRSNEFLARHLQICWRSAFREATALCTSDTDRKLFKNFKYNWLSSDPISTPYPSFDGTIYFLSNNLLDFYNPRNWVLLKRKRILSKLKESIGKIS